MAYKIDKNKASGATKRAEPGLSTPASSMGRDGFSPNVEFYELEPAVVIDVELNPKVADALGVAKIRPIYSFNGIPNNLLPTAFPLDSNVKSYPLKNEIVICVKYANKWYYTQRLNYANSVNSNIIGSPPITGEQTTRDADYTATSLGNPNTTDSAQQSQKSGRYFQPNRLIRSLLPLEGDIIYEGRFGNSIRFGGTVSDDITLPTQFTNGWARGKQIGSPIVILRNGQSPKQNPKSQTDLSPGVEDINNDASSIYLTSDQTIPIVTANNTLTSWNGTAPSLYEGKQVIITSDRLIFNSRKEELMMFAYKSIGLSTKASLNIDADTSMVVNSPKIQFGIDAQEPIVLGNKTRDWLVDMVGAMRELIDAVKNSFVATGTGPSSPIGETSEALFTPVVQKLQSLENKLDGILSKQNYTV